MGTEPARSGWTVYPSGEWQPRACGSGPLPGYAGTNKQHVPVKAMSIFVLILRVASLLLSLLALGFILLAQDKYHSGSSTFSVRIDGKALRTRANKFLAAMSAVIVLYEGAQMVFAYLEKTTQSVDRMSGHFGTLVTFVSDQVLAYLLFAAGAAAGNDVARWRRGDGEVNDGVCSAENSSWCTKVEIGVAMSYFAFTALTMLAVVSGFKFSKHLEHSMNKDGY